MPRAGQPDQPDQADRPDQPAVRRATVADIDELLRLAAVMLVAVGYDPTVNDWAERGARRVTTGFADGTVAGFVVDHPEAPGRLRSAAMASVNQRLPTPANPDGRVAYVQWVATDPAFRRQGVARALILAIIEWAAGEDIAYVDLHASTDGEPLYRSLGFDENRNPELRLRVL